MYRSPDLSNNPFINDPSQPHTRFPDLNSQSSVQDPGTSQFAPWLQQQPGATSPTSYFPQQSGLYQQPTFQPQQQFTPGYNTAYPIQNVSPPPTNQPFQPLSSFGQQLAGQINGSAYGYPQQQGQNPTSPQSGFLAQQQTQTSPGYLAQFDPYAPVGQGWEGQAQVQSPTQVQSPGSSSATSPTGDPHPRNYIRTHKAEIESWDTYAWKQLLNTFDALKGAWEKRKKDVGLRLQQLQPQVQQAQYSGDAYYMMQIEQEGARLQGLMKEADSNFDSVAASSFQMHEVFQGYRQSGDLASKRRVREASNAALQGLPEWPSQVY